MLQHTRVFVAPILVETGVSTKIVEALGYGEREGLVILKCFPSRTIRPPFSLGVPVVTTVLGEDATPPELRNMIRTVSLDDFVDVAIETATKESVSFRGRFSCLYVRTT